MDALGILQGGVRRNHFAEEVPVGELGVADKVEIRVEIFQCVDDRSSREAPSEKGFEALTGYRYARAAILDGVRFVEDDAAEEELGGD